MSAPPTNSSPCCGRIAFDPIGACAAAKPPGSHVSSETDGVETDFFGTARPQGDSFDIGAHELES